jgi:hypothetical protein
LSRRTIAESFGVAGREPVGDRVQLDFDSRLDDDGPQRRQTRGAQNQSPRRA